VSAFLGAKETFDLSTTFSAPKWSALMHSASAAKGLLDKWRKYEMYKSSDVAVSLDHPSFAYREVPDAPILAPGPV
jgi:hypothetical protein